MVQEGNGLHRTALPRRVDNRHIRRYSLFFKPPGTFRRVAAAIFRIGDAANEAGDSDDLNTGNITDTKLLPMQGKYNIAILLGQATPGIFPGVSTINTFNIQLAISIPYFSNNPLFSPFSDHSTQTL